MAAKFRALSEGSDVGERGIKVRNTRHPTVPSNIIRAGFLTKHSGGMFRTWRRRFFVLNPQCLCYFRNEREVNDQGKEPSKRLFLSDVITVTGDSPDLKHSFIINIHTAKWSWVLQAASEEDQAKWIEVLDRAIEADKKAEASCPKRLSMKRVNEDTKRVLLIKEGGSIGCTIKKAGEFLIVSRVIEGSYVARTGILRPDDEILEIDGSEVKDKGIEEVIGLIKAAPESILATIRPFRPVPKVYDNSPSSYTQVAPFSVGKTKSTPRAAQAPDSLPLPPATSLPIHYADLQLDAGEEAPTQPGAVPSFYCNMDLDNPKK